MDSTIGRRTFLHRLGKLAAVTAPLAFTSSGCATGLASYRAGISQGKIILLPSQYPELGEIGGGIELDIPSFSDRIVVVRTGENAYVALSSTCTHLGCTVRKEPSFFRCPCHGSTYTIEGTVVRGPAEKPLQRYDVEANNQQVIISIQG